MPGAYRDEQSLGVGWLRVEMPVRPRLLFKLLVSL
jgi:hypothetical protein